MKFARRETFYTAKVDEPDFKKCLEAQYGRMKVAEETKLTKAVKQFSEAMTYFEKQRFTDPDEAKIYVRQLPSKMAKVAWLQEKYYIRTNGYGWIEFKAAFSSDKDKTISTPENPLKRLIQITKKEKYRTPPEVPPDIEPHSKGSRAGHPHPSGQEAKGRVAVLDRGPARTPRRVRRS